MLAKLGGSCMFSNGSSFLYAISFYFFLSSLLSPWRRPILLFFYDFFSALMLLNRMLFPYLPCPLDSTSCSEQNKGRNGNKRQNGQKEGSVCMDWAVMHFGPRMRMRM
ncbi:hypothetical protein ACMYSQ_000894 [Aspergillus niger]